MASSSVSVRSAQRLPEVLSVLHLWLVRQLRRPIKTRDEVSQAFALDQDVLPEQPLRPVTISGMNGINDALVLCE